MHHLHGPVTRVVGFPDPSIGEPSPNLSAGRTVRAGDDDRRRVAGLLQAHYVVGRLTSVEFEERIERSLAARTLGDLDALLADLPRLDPGTEQRASRERRAERCRKVGEKSFQAHATSYLLVMALLVAIWLLTTPGGYFWPIWPALGWGIGLASHGLAAGGLGRPRLCS
jgi:hypothetical protein